jgi:hypothetical protein
MRALFRITLAASLLVWCGFAQRGGGHAGGGGSRGGGGFSGGHSGGGFSGGGGFTGGHVGGGAMRGGGSIGGFGGFQGGTFGGNHGGSFGVNRGGSFGFFHGVVGGFNRGYYGRGYGYGYRGGYWPYGGWGVGLGWGFPLYGWGYGAAYWPGYYDYDGWDYPSYGYAYGDPGSYVYNTVPNTTVVYPQSTNAYAPQAYAPQQPVHPVVHTYDQYGQEVRPQAANGAPSSPIYLFAMKDGSIHAASSYSVENGTLHYVAVQNNEQKTASLTAIDRTLTDQLNRERRVNLNLGQQQ